MIMCNPPPVGPPPTEPIDGIEFAKVYQRSFAKTCKFVCSLGADYNTAEEIAQSAWARGWQRRHQLLQPQFLATWVHAIARNLYRESYAKARRLTELDEYGFTSNVLHKIEVEDMLSNCTKPETHFLHLVYFEGYTSEEIAARHKVSPVTIRVRLMRLRQSLRERSALKIA
jgi:RNA polymerase sigma factor (sigma-70 family)